MATTDLLGKMREDRTHYSVVLYEYIKRVGANEGALYCFFEGSDDQYYSPRLRSRRWQKGIQYIECFGKDNVLTVRKKLLEHETYAEFRRYFFVDRDFDMTVISKDLYVTPGYSVENLYVNEDCFSEVLMSEFKIRPGGSDDEEYLRILELFRNCLSQYCNVIEPLNVWVLANRKSYHEGLAKKISIGGININKYLNITPDGSVSLALIDDILDKSGVDRSLVTMNEIESARNVAESFDPIVDFRGKFQSMFYCQFLKMLIQDSNSHSPQLFTRRRIVRLQVNMNNLLSALSQYAVTPPCLSEFISNM